MTEYDQGAQQGFNDGKKLAASGESSPEGSSAIPHVPLEISDTYDWKQGYIKGFRVGWNVGKRNGQTS